MKNTQSFKTLRRLLGVAIVAAVGATTTLAFATDTGPSQVNAVEYGNNFLLIQLANGTNYVASTSQPSGCGPNASSDTLKVWAAQAQAALLAGKNVKIYYATCSSNSAKYINTMDIWN